MIVLFVLVCVCLCWDKVPWVHFLVLFRSLSLMEAILPNQQELLKRDGYKDPEEVERELKENEERLKVC